MINKNIFLSYGIRGNAKNDLDAEISYQIGYIFARKSISETNKIICVGCDARASSKSIVTRVIHGLLDGGADVRYCGLVPTPLLYFADRKLEAAGSIMVTGSNRPQEENGFKFLKKSHPFFGNDIQQLYVSILKTNWNDIKYEENKYSIPPVIEFQREYILEILQGIKINSNLKIAIDVAHGVTGIVTAELVKALPCSTIIINDKIDASISNNDQDPGSEKNLAELKASVVSNKCDLGIALSGDGDCIVVVTDQGQTVYGDQLLCIYAKEILANDPGAKIVADVKASQVFFDFILKAGGVPVMSKSGHCYVRQKMHEVNAMLGGEMGGHIFFADHYYGYDDGIYASLRLINFLSIHNTKSLDYHVNLLDKVYNTPEIRINVDNLTKDSVIEQIKISAVEQGKDFYDIDGLRIKTKHGWYFLMASQTQPFIIVRCESTSEKGLDLVKKELQAELVRYNITLKI